MIRENNEYTPNHSFESGEQAYLSFDLISIDKHRWGGPVLLSMASEKER